MTGNPTVEQLCRREKALPLNYPQDLKLRIHRSLSWFRRAEKQAEDDDAAFIFCWVAFNALYGVQFKDTNENDSERSAFQEFFRKISLLDTDRLIYNELWRQFSDSVRVLIQNRYVFQPFWNHYHEVAGYEDWQQSFKKAIDLGHRALENGDVPQILSIIFDRLYVLRNQVFHGAATWAGSVNRAQIKDARRILAFLLPLFVDLMMRHPDVPWGSPGYAVVE